MQLVYGILWGIAGQILSFLQLQGSIKYHWDKDYPWMVYASAILDLFLFIQSVKCIVTYFDGQLWPSRLIGFGIGIIIFSTMSWVMFKEPITFKTLACLILAGGILAIQILWK